jgi:hypothetical protein
VTYSAAKTISTAGNVNASQSRAVMYANTSMGAAKKLKVGKPSGKVAVPKEIVTETYIVKIR